MSGNTALKEPSTPSSSNISRTTCRSVPGKLRALPIPSKREHLIRSALGQTHGERPADDVERLDEA